MLKVILTGSLGNDATIKDLGDKKAINFNVAVSMDYKDSSGTKVDKTEWVKAVIWKHGNQSIKIADYLKKGKKVLIEGIPDSHGYKSKDGDVKAELHVNVKDLELLS